MYSVSGVLGAVRKTPARLCRLLIGPTWSGTGDKRDEALAGGNGGRLGVQRLFVSHSFNFDQRRRPDTLRTAIATAFFCPTNTTSRFPRVTPV